MPDDIKTEDSELSLDSILDQLNLDESKESDDDKREEAKEEAEEDTEKVSEDNEEEDEKEEGLEEKEIKIEDKDEDELVVADVPRRKEILKAYPDLFKKFPGVEKAIYREQQYTEIFPSLAEAREAVERLETLKNVESELYSGDISGILAHVKRTDEKAFSKITGNILRTLSAVDKDAHLGLTTNVVQSAIKWAYDNGAKIGGDEGKQLTIAAQLLNKFFFNSIEIKAPADLSTNEREDPREKEIETKQKNFEEKQLDTARREVSSRIFNTIQSAVNKYIDPKGVMTNYVKDKAMSDAIKEVDRELTTDKRFRAVLDKLWEASRKDGYSEESKARIRKAVINRAQVILPDAIRKVRGEALKGMGVSKRKPNKSDEDDEQPVRRREATPERKSSNQSGKKPLRASTVDDVLDYLG